MSDWLDERAKQFLRSRRTAYLRTFDPENNIDHAIVLKDLAKFCRAHESTASVDPYMAAKLDGRREVWLRVQTHLQLSDEQLWALHGGAPQPRE